MTHWLQHKPLLHYSSVPRTGASGVPVEDQPRAHKPKGLWFSVGRAWAEWCEAEDFHLECLEHCSQVELTDDARILALTCQKDVLEFSSRYGVPYHYGGALGSSVMHVDWPRVAQRYQGIVITPYVWECRHDDRCSWYYSWDVASGCVWDAGAIASVRPLEEVTA